MSAILIGILFGGILILWIKYRLDSRKWAKENEEIAKKYEKLSDEKKRIETEMEKQRIKREGEHTRLEETLRLLRETEEKVEKLENNRKQLYASVQNIHLYGQLVNEECETEAGKVVLRECEKVLENCVL